MELNELIDRAQRLRREQSAMRERLEQTSSELEQVKRQLDDVLQRDGRAVSALSEEEFQRLLGELGDAKRITVTVVYATRDEQRAIDLELSQGASIEDAIMVSGILELFPEIDLAASKVGVHGAIKPIGHSLQAGDRVEIYRPVTAS